MVESCLDRGADGQVGQTHQIPRDSDVGIWSTFKDTLFLRNLYSFLFQPQDSGASVMKVSPFNT